MYRDVVNQITATAYPASGASTDVSSETTYVSADPAIASMTPTGVLTPRHPGVTVVIARYKDLTASRRVTVELDPAKRYPDEIRGNIAEVLPTRDFPVSLLQNVTVQVAGGEHDGRVIDAPAGYFRVDGFSRGGFDLLVSRPGFQPQRVPVPSVPASLDIRLDPAPLMCARHSSGTSASRLPCARPSDPPTPACSM